MRLFVALNLPDALRERIDAEVLAPLREQVPAVRWLRPAFLHVTLAFLGERSDAEERNAEGVVHEIADGRGPLAVTLRGLGVFPSPDRPRVVWMGVADPTPVRALHRAFERERARLGLPAEGRAYHPHVTLGRVPRDISADARTALVQALETVQFEAATTLRSVDLMRSEPTPAGARYTALAVAPLNAPEAR